MHNIVVHTAHRFHKGCLNSDRNFPGAVCLFPNIPSGLTETLEIKSRWSPLYATFFDCVKKEMPSLTSLQSWINSSFISCWRRTQQDLKMRYQNITKHRFKEEFMCFPLTEMYYLCYGHRNTCCPVLSAAARPIFLQLFTSGPLGGFQAQRLWESISMWGYLIQAHNLRPDLDTGPSVIQAQSRNEVDRWIQIQGI